jgi:hypothetical protein
MSWLALKLFFGGALKSVAAWLSHRSFWQLAFGAALILAGIQTIRFHAEQRQNRKLSTQLSKTIAGLDAVAEHGTITAAADALGINRATLQSRVNEARRRKAGMVVTGRSTLTDLRTGEPVMEWVKESLDRQRAAEAQQAAYAALAAKLPRNRPTVPPRASEGHLARSIP